MKNTKRTPKIICLTLVLLGIYFTSISNIFAQRGSRFNAEIRCEVKNLEGENEEWTVTAECLSTYRWWYVDEKCYLTTGYSFASISGTGNSTSDFGFQSPHSPDEQHDLAWAEYKFTFDMPDGYSDKSFTLDLRDANWSGNYYPHDIYIRYDVDSGALDRKIAGGSYSTLNEDSIWGIYGISQPNQEAFQPTKSESFSCSNPNVDGQNPIFIWSPSRHVDPGLIKYKIYRNLYDGKTIIATDLVAHDWTDLTWTDEEVVIESDGNHFSYYCIAYTGQSPESDASNLAHINGLYSQKPLTEDDEIKTSIIDTLNVCRLILSAHPNPFNPLTSIFYIIPTEGYVHISIYNITGQRVKELVDENEPAGVYQTYFSGQALAGGVYLVRLQFNDKYLTKKILLFK